MMFNIAHASMPAPLKWRSECLSDARSASTRLDVYILKLRQESAQHFWPHHSVSVIANKDLITINSLRVCIDVYVPGGLKNVVFVKIKPKGRVSDILMLAEVGSIEAIENALYEYSDAPSRRDCGITDVYA